MATIKGAIICIKAIFKITILSILPFNVFSQSLIVSGEVKDAQGTALEGAHVYFLETFKGSSSDREGRFRLEAKLAPPQILVVSMLGYNTYYDTLRREGNHEVDVVLSEDAFMGNEVIVSASRVEESVMLSPITVEKLTLRDLQQMPQANFYDGLYKLKGVDMNVQSLTFRNPNTRGFNGNTNFRFNQVVDGVNNMSPGLSFSAGNMLGLSPLDVESVELLTGASSALYGPGGLNGTLVMHSKDPFDYRGLSGSVQLGGMRFGVENASGPTPYYDVNIRYSKVYNDKFAVKFVGGYLTADDWVANDFRDKTNLDDPSLNRYNSSSYDGVNTYGDEFALDLVTQAPTIAHSAAITQGAEEGTQEYENIYNAIYGIFVEDPTFKVTRTGWQEKDLVNYDAHNLKGNLSFHYKFDENKRAILQGGYAEGQAVYSAQNRFSINDFKMYNLKAEFTGEDYFLRYWWVKEDAGTTYDAGAVGALINEAWKPSEVWFQDYISGYINGRLGFGLDKTAAHRLALINADNRLPNGNIQDPEKPAFPLPGEPVFEQAFDELKNTPLNEGGARVLDFSSMGQLEAMYNFRRFLNDVDLIAGFQVRHLNVNSRGTVFFDEPGDPIAFNQWGVYTQYIDDFFDEHLRVNLSARWDKDPYFDGEFTPRLSTVISFGPNNEHNIRMSAQTAFRFPAIQDQWTDLQVGGVQVVGGQREVQEAYGFFDAPLYPLIGISPITALPDTTREFTIPAFVAETVQAYEIGYKSLLLGNNLLLDASLFYNIYDGFQGNQLLVQNPYTPEERRFQTVVSLEQDVANWGWSMGLDYQMLKSYVVGGNVTYSTLSDNQEFDQGFQTRFNTPPYRYNLYVNNRRLLKNIGFSVNWHWQDTFVWESSFGVGEIPAYGSLDMQLTLQLPKISSSVKVGGSNVMNDYYTTSFGSPQIGGLYYVSFLYDQMMR